MRAFLEGLSQESRAFRFFSAGATSRRRREPGRRRRLRRPLRHRGDRRRRPDDPRARRRTCASGPAAAEVAFAVADALQGEGIATTMLAHLGAGGARGGHRAGSWPTSCPRTTACSTCSARAGFARQRALGARRAACSRCRPRSTRGAQRALRRARRDRRRRRRARTSCAPRRVAVVGASRPTRARSAARSSPTAGRGLRRRAPRRQPRAPARCTASPASPSVADIPGAGRPRRDRHRRRPPCVDVARDVRRQGRARARRRLRRLRARPGEEGAARQHELLASAAPRGMRLVGPNCLGVINTDPAVRLNATLRARRRRRPATSRFLSQSGALGHRRRSTPRATRASGCRRSSRSATRPTCRATTSSPSGSRTTRTDVVLLYLESFGNPRKFARVARRVAARKPIVAVKGGRSAAGRARRRRRTPARCWPPPTPPSTRCSRRPASCAPTRSASCSTSRALLDAQPLPARPRGSGIVTNGGGLGILCADACEAAGLEVVRTPPPACSDARARRCRRGAALGNPIDLLAAATPEQFAAAIEALAASGAVDALDRALRPAARHRPRGASRPRSRDAADRCAPAGRRGLRDARGARRASPGCPRFRFPEDAARALGRAARVRRVARGAARAGCPRSSTPTTARPRRSSPGALRARAGLAGARRGGGAARRATASPSRGGRSSRDADAAGDAGARWRRAVALKAVAPGPGAPQRRRRGGARAARRAHGRARAARRCAARARRRATRSTGFLVQEMARPGRRDARRRGRTTRRSARWSPCAAGGVRDRAARRQRGPAHAADRPRRARRWCASCAPSRCSTASAARRAPTWTALEDVLLRIERARRRASRDRRDRVQPADRLARGALAVDVRARVDGAAAARPEPSLRGPV